MFMNYVYIYFFVFKKKYLAHVFVGPLSPGAALIVEYCDFSANIICITVEIFTTTLWLWVYWKVVPN